MGKRKAPDTPLFDPVPESPSLPPPPQRQAKRRQPEEASPPAPAKRQGGPTTPSETDAGDAGKAFSFRLNSKDAPPPVTFFETNTRGPNPWSFSKFPGVKVTMVPYGATKAPVEEAEAPRKATPVVEKTLALPEVVEKQVAASPEAAKAAPVKSEVEAQASASPSPGAAKAEPAASAPLQAPPPKIALVQTQRWVCTPTLASYVESGVGQLVGLSITDPASWEHLVGLYVQESGRTPLQVAFTTLDGAGLQHPVQGLGKWSRDWRKVDVWDMNPTVADRWPLTTEGSLAAHLCRQIVAGIRQNIFEEAVRRWAMCCPLRVEGVMRRAGYMLKCDRPHEFSIMSAIKKMSEGAEKEGLVAQARRESPRFAEECMMNEYCGVHKITRKRRGDDGIEVDQEFVVFTTTTSRREIPFTPPEELFSESEEESLPKKSKMSAPRPTQFHAVPLDERAVDSKGQTLPWSLEWHEDHPNARHQKRQHEEKGPFGKSMRRRGSSRATTPAKKENPTLDGFETALKYDLQRAAAEAQEKSNISKPHNESVTAVSSSVKVPTQVSLYGFAPGTHWAAIDFYERASLGSICEDYDRDPPIERRRIPNAFAAAQMVRSRALTKQEAVLARQYHGGNSWIKVTFDSAEAADRAISFSPHQIQGHWIYAELFHGTEPNHPDEPIPLQKEDLRRGPYGSPAPAPRASRSLGPSFAQNNNSQTRFNATLPRSFTSTSKVEEKSQEGRDVTSQSSSTATSATATAPEYPDLRNRLPQRPNTNQPGETVRTPQRDPRFFTHFPDVPRTVLRPAHEALLPQPTWLEAWFQRLAANGWLPGDMIGNGPPFLDNGEFDWATASLYWKVFYWFDSHTWTDFCGTKDA